MTEYVENTYKHVFIGVGDEHDSYLLTNLSQNTSLGEYRFIDQLDHAGLICGEILYDILFPYAFCDDPIHLIASEGVKIYDWRINQWTSTLLIPPFSGNRSKDFQLRFESESGQEDAMIDIYSKMTRLDTAMVLPRLIDYVDGTLVPNNLTQFILKQYTQEYLYEAIQYEITFRADMLVLLKDDLVGLPTRLQRSTSMSMDSVGIKRNMQAEIRCHIPKDDVGVQRNMNVVSTHIPKDDVGVQRNMEKNIRDKLTHFHTTLQTYQEKYHEDESFKKFVQVLKDDIRITLKNLGTQLGYMYSNTRQTSQGHQYSYTPTGEEHISEDESTNLSNGLQRNITTYTNPHILDMMTQVQDTVTYDDMLPSSTIGSTPEIIYNDDLPTPIQRNSSTNTFTF